MLIDDGGRNDIEQCLKNNFLNLPSTAFIAVDLVALPSCCYDAARKENAMIELTQQQRQAVHEQSEVRLIDPQTKEAFVLIRAEAYDKKAPLSALKGLDILPAIRLRARKKLRH